ncbi:MAG: type II toxin-antitoxin system VapC family toxin [Methanobacteriota archaeon]|nr:MAG: type II toxin-antitoxin system VapC family toxin [Euryarchaeota archaeon]
MKALDSTALIDALEGDASLLRKVPTLDRVGVATTEVNAFETLVGFFFRGGPTLPERLEAVHGMLGDLTVFPLDRGGALKAAEVAAELAREGRTLGTGDALTAGIILSRGVDTIVTRDVEHFHRIRGLKVEGY